MFIYMIPRIHVYKHAPIELSTQSEPFVIQRFHLCCWTRAHLAATLVDNSYCIQVVSVDFQHKEQMFETYCDADHGGDRDRGKSTSGYMVKLGLGVVAWSSKLQSVVTLSTTEAEYVSGVAAGKEICWMQQLLKEVGYCLQVPFRLYIDNQSAISVAKNPEHHGRMKHLDLAFFWLRDKVEEKRIEMMYMRTEEMPADLLTKALPKPQVIKLRKMMGLVE